MEAKDTVMSINTWLDRHRIDRAYKADMKTTYAHFRGELEAQAELSFRAGEEDMLQRIGPRIKEALQAPTHDANDYNCADWPPGEGCSGCKGDEVRRQAIEWLAALKDKGLKEV